MTINLTLCATPYQIGAPFFYFESIEEYNQKYELHLKKYGVEEYEFEYIDGDDISLTVWKACNGNMFKFLEIIEEGMIATLEDAIKLYVATNINGNTLEDALLRYQGIYLWCGSMKDYAYEIFQWDLVPEFLHQYINIDQLVIDLQCNGDIYELDGDFDGYCVVR